MTSSSDSSSLYNSTVLPDTFGPLFQCSTPASPLSSNLIFSFRPHRIFSICTINTASYSWLFFHTSCFLLPLTRSGFFNGMLELSEPGALNYYTLFRLNLLTLFVSMNLTLIYLPLLGSLDYLLCDLIAPTPGLVFSLPIPRTLAAASSFSSGRVYPSLNFLPLLFLRLTPILIM